MKKWMKESIHRLYLAVYKSPLCGLMYYLNCFVDSVRAVLNKKPYIPPEDVKNVEENVTFIYKSFNRQKQAAQLYRNIRSYYPEVRIIIADDSETPLDLPGVIRLPFNSGLSKGLIAALEQVETPFVMRMDDDEMLTAASNIHGQLKYLQSHPQVDLVGIQPSKKSRAAADRYSRFVMKKPLLIPAGTEIDGKTVVYKTANIFLARTEKVRMVGYDPNIRMNDHHEFFWRAAGAIVSVLDPDAYVLHLHNRFDRKYDVFRNDTVGDMKYIGKKNNHYRG